MPLETLKNERFVGKVLVVIGLVVLTFLLGVLIYFTFDVILLIFSAVLIAVFLRGLADFVNRYTRLSEGLSVLLVSVLLLAILAGAIALLAPDVVEQFRLLRDKLPNSLQKVRANVEQFNFGKVILEQIKLPTQEAIVQYVKDFDFSSILSRVGGYFSSTVGALGNFFITILLAVYLASEPKFYVSGLTKLFPVRARPRVAEILSKIGETLGWWLIGKVASMIFIGLLTWIGLSILGVPLALTLGLIAGLLSFIPNFGPIFSALPAILLAFIDSPIKALYVLILFIAVQLIESNLVTPFIERRTVEMPPALTVVAQIALGVLVGGVGLVLATPILAVAMVLVQTAYIEDVLGDREEPQKENDKAVEDEAKEQVAETQDS